MIVAMMTVHRTKPFFVQTGGIEHPLMFAISALAIALTGPGRYSLDAALGLTRWETPRMTLIVLLIGIIGGFANLAVRRQPATKAG
jgi:putative oxidoreductase